MRIVPATIEDLPVIVDIYNSTIAGGMITSDLDSISVESRVDWFSAHTVERRPLWVARAENNTLGWISLSDFYGRPAYNRTVEISVYVHPNHKRKHVGTELLQHALVHAPQCGIDTLVAFIFAANHSSLQLFQKFGFIQWGKLPEVAETRTQVHDVIVLGCKL